MAGHLLPPGLSSSDVESATASRERRRVALAAKVAIDELTGRINEQFEMMATKQNLIMSLLQENLIGRISRLETLSLCGSTLSPSVDEVLNEMLSKKKMAESIKHTLPEVPTFPILSRKSHLRVQASNKAPSDLQLASCTEHYKIGELQADAIVQTDVWEPLLNKSCAEAHVQTVGGWKSMHEHKSQCCGPDLGTLDEIDLLPPLLGGEFVSGQVVWTNTPLRLQSGALIPSSSMGRILRQHVKMPSVLWVYFENDGDMVSVATEHLDKTANQDELGE